MSNKNDGGPAFPHFKYVNEKKELTYFMSGKTGVPIPCGVNDGMSLRDYFAAKAMEGCLRADVRLENNTISGLAEMSYAIADAMLKTREE